MQNGDLAVINGSLTVGWDIDANGTINATNYSVGGTAGISRLMTVRDAGGLTDCTITVTNGIITASTC